eukprot:m.98960 g.98960  ORF g.98960 m.98960 type:complete len:2628 (+) comp13656_c0_seq1:122-8005(+)
MRDIMGGVICVALMLAYVSNGQSSSIPTILTSSSTSTSTTVATSTSLFSTKFASFNTSTDATSTTTYSAIYANLSTSTATTTTASILAEQKLYTECGRIVISNTTIGDTGRIESNTDLTYTQDRTCEWVIMGPQNSSIEFQIDSFLTECGFDFLLVYDGTSYRTARLLATLSGGEKPSGSLIAESGTMLLLFLSDLNVALRGFKGTFSVNEKTIQNVSDVNNTDYSPDANFGHSSTVVNNTIWFFGGFDLSVTKNTVFSREIDSNSSEWEERTINTTEPVPSGRYWHAATHAPSLLSIIVIGGMKGVDDNYNTSHVAYFRGKRSNEIWNLDLKNMKWSSLSNVEGPPPICLHTATTVGDSIYIIGGSVGQGEFSKKIFVYKEISDEWTSFVPSGELVQMAGHSAVYWETHNVIYVFGGFRHAWSGQSERTNSLYIFNPTSQSWTKRNPLPSYNIPKMALHSATVLNNSKMYIFGGFGDNFYNNGQQCFIDHVHEYDMNCNEWVVYPRALPPGRMSLSAAGLKDSVLLFGGFNGEPLILPSNVIFESMKSRDECSACSLWTSCEECSSDAFCGWCDSAASCQDKETSSCTDLVEESASCEAPSAGFWLETWDSMYDVATGVGANRANVIPTSSVSEQSCDFVFHRMKGNIKVDAGVYNFRIVGNGTARCRLTWNSESGVNDLDAAQLELFKEDKAFHTNASRVIFLNPTELTVLFEHEAIYNARTACSIALEWDIPGSDIFVPIPLSNARLSPADSSICADYTTCRECGSALGCTWCHQGNSSQCIVSSSEETTCMHTSQHPASCRTCKDFKDCLSCANNEELQCQWSGGLCIAGGVESNKSMCSAPCSQRQNCSTCLTEEPFNPCGWCETTQTCFDFADYVTEVSLAQCKRWHRSESVGGNGCTSCEKYKDCDSCFLEAHCGWCYDPTHVERGRCQAGVSDAILSAAGDWIPSETCSLPNPCYLNASTNNSEKVLDDLVCENANTSLEILDGTWAYTWCPDRNECARGLDECGNHSSCRNLNPGNYECICDDGYEYNVGDNPGFQSNPCIPKCCEHATCERPFECECEPGWRGANCTEDCGCNLHGVCPETPTDGGNVTIPCLECKHNTTGATCDTCAPGFYGDPRNGGKCKPCDCDGHGDPERGYCDNKTGICFCQDFTTGDHCDSCLNNMMHFGDRCYYSCDLPSSNPNNVGYEHRQVLSARKAGISTGRLDPSRHVYTMCSWLIRAPSANHTITLEFESLNTECHYDYVHVFDSEHPDLQSQLGAYAGIHVPTPVKSTSGTMLITLLSDANYVLSGNALQVKYEINLCPQDCNGRGVCGSDGRCKCNNGFSGVDCGYAICPNRCSSHGVCQNQVCVCSPGYVGADCNTTDVGDTWNPVNHLALGMDASTSHLERAGHCTVYDIKTDSMWIFGGTVLKNVLSDVRSFDFETNTWNIVQNGTEAGPAGRFLHACAMVYIDDLPYMFINGGSTEGSEYFHETWLYSLSDGTWAEIEQNAESPPATIGHTATVVDGKVYIFGGITKEELTSRLFVYDIVEKTWSGVNPRVSMNLWPDGVFGHSAVYDEDAGHIIYFGGRRRIRQTTTAANAYKIERSGLLFAYSVSDGLFKPMWPKSDCATNDVDCMARSLHSAVIVKGENKKFMLVFGGCPFAHGDGELGRNWHCVSDELLILDLTCGASSGWLTTVSRQELAPLDQKPPGRIQHSLFYRPKDASLIVFGGFGGAALGDIYRYRLPSPLQFCDRHGNFRDCETDIYCDWNQTASECQYNMNSVSVPDCKRYETEIQCSQDFRCNLIQKNESFECIDVDELTTCPVTNGSFNCSGEIWGLCNSQTDSSCNSNVDVCNACLSNPFCTACTSLRYNYGLNCKREVTTTCQQDGGVSSGVPNNVSICSVCGAFKTCSECRPEDGCLWNEVSRTCSQARGFTPNPPVCVSCDGRNETSCDKARGCGWCESIGVCFPDAALQTEFSLGICFERPGTGTQDACARALSCGDCLATSDCGWCSAPGVVGEGVCELGSVFGPAEFAASDESTRSQCFSGNVSHKWEWYDCSDEDECLSGNSKCGANATCVNENRTADELADPRGYRCECPIDLRLDDDGLNCIPRCDKFGCVNGDCVALDTCACHLGYHGSNCSTDCGCNLHSSCDSQGPGWCDECLNNTEGPTCAECKPGFYGNGSAGAAPYNGQCYSCYDVCNGNSETCKRHPTDEGPVCENCENNTHGEYCEECNDGYFLAPYLQQEAHNNCPLNFRSDNIVCLERYLESDIKIHATCVPCMCNGHDNHCHPVNGEGCNCTNFTETQSLSCTSARKTNGSCYSVQCSSCLPEGTLLDSTPVKLEGDPVDGALCYFVTPYDLLIERSISPYEVHTYQADPKFTNLDIRFIVEAETQKTLNVYITNGFGTSINRNSSLLDLSTLRDGFDVVASSTDGFEGRLSLTASYEDYNFVISKFFIHVQHFGSTSEPVLYRIFYTQPRLKLDLVIFFTVFFSVFYLLIVVASYPVFWKVSRMARQMEQAEVQQMEVMAARAMATVNVLMSDHIPVLEDAKKVAELQARKELPMTPIAYQHLRKQDNVAVASYLVELPSDSSYRNISLAYALIKNPTEGSPRRNVSSTVSSSRERHSAQTAL